MSKPPGEDEAREAAIFTAFARQSFVEAIEKIEESTEDRRATLTQRLIAIAASKGFTEFLHVMTQSPLQQYCDFDQTDDRRDTCFTKAARNGHLDTLHFILSFGVDIFHRNRDEKSALDVASENGHVECVDAILDHATEKRAYGGRGLARYLYSGVLGAIESGHRAVVKRYLDAGLSVNINMDVDLGTPLHYAVEVTDVELVDDFLSFGADVEALRTRLQQTPLMLAAHVGHRGIVERLLDAGADLNRQTHECSAALTLACHNGHSEVVRSLIARGADVNKKNRWGFNALFMGTDSPDILQMLLEAGSNPDVPCGDRDECPIHLAAVVGDPEAVEILLSHNCDVNVRTNVNENALWLATWKGNTEVVKLLIQQNIELNVASNACNVYSYDYTCLEVAMGLGHFEIMMLLIQNGCHLINRVYFTPSDPPPNSELPWFRLRPEPLSVLVSSAEWLETVKEWLRNPMALKRRCRMLIRSHIQGNLVKSVQSLGLPRPLRQWLTLCDL